MKPFRVTAPGKLFLMGEYAVLEGAEAVVTAVNRRVCARPGARAPDGLVAIALSRAASRLGRADLANQPIEVDSASLFAGKKKLGLGSSAAVAAAVVATALHSAEQDLSSPESRRLVLETACEAHDAFQRTRGSGADVAAATYGGMLVVRRASSGPPEVRPWTPPAGVHWAFLWTGSAASTKRRIWAVRRLKRLIPMSREVLFREMTQLSSRFVSRGSTDPATLFETMNSYADLMAMVGRLAGVPIVTPAISKVIWAARKMGGAAKPSGAGGGDFAVAALPESASLEAFSRLAAPEARWFADLQPEPDGVRVEEFAATA